jgi:hypothetical protein
VNEKRFERFKELVADGLREVGVLMCVFGALDFRLSQTRGKSPDPEQYWYALYFMGVGVFAAVIGIVIDLTRKEFSGKDSDEDSNPPEMGPTTSQTAN